MSRMSVFPVPRSFALRSTSFRKFLYGSFLTRTAEWMDMTILNWVVYQWTNSPMTLAVLNASRLLPVFVFSLPAGFIADRFNRQKVLIFNYFGLFLSTILLAFLIQGQYSVLSVITVVTLRAILMTIEVPVRNVFLADLVPKPMLASAISIQTTIINLARMIGPALAGILLVRYSPGTLMYFISGGTLFIMLSLFFIDPIEKKVVTRVKNGARHPMKETWQYISKHPMVISILLISIAPMIFGFPYTTMLPLFSKELLGMGPDGFGLLLSVSSLGAIVATILLSFGKPKNSGRLLIVSVFCFGISLSFFMLLHQNYILILVFMFFIGFSSQYYRTSSRVMLQLHVEESYRGRVMSIALMDRGYIPLGALFVGWIGHTFGALSAGLFMGIGCCLSTLCIALLRKNLWNGQE